MKEPQNPETPAKTIRMEPRRVFVGGLSLHTPQPGPEPRMEEDSLHRLPGLPTNYKLFPWVSFLGEQDPRGGGGKEGN